MFSLIPEHHIWLKLQYTTQTDIDSLGDAVGDDKKYHMESGGGVKKGVVSSLLRKYLSYLFHKFNP